MLTLLSMALAGEELPDQLPLSVSLLPPQESAGGPVLVVVLHNPNPVQRTLAIRADTVRVARDDGAELAVRWSLQAATIRPGERLAVFGTLPQPAAPGTLRVWLCEGGQPAGDRAPDAALLIEADDG